MIKTLHQKRLSSTEQLKQNNKTSAASNLTAVANEESKTEPGLKVGNKPASEATVQNSTKETNDKTVAINNQPRSSPEKTSSSSNNKVAENNKKSEANLSEENQTVANNKQQPATNNLPSPATKEIKPQATTKSGGKETLTKETLDNKPASNVAVENDNASKVADKSLLAQKNENAVVSKIQQKPSENNLTSSNSNSINEAGKNNSESPGKASPESQQNKAETDLADQNKVAGIDQKETRVEKNNEQNIAINKPAAKPKSIIENQKITSSSEQAAVNGGQKETQVTNKINSNEKLNQSDQDQKQNSKSEQIENTSLPNQNKNTAATKDLHAENQKTESNKVFNEQNSIRTISVGREKEIPLQKAEIVKPKIVTPPPAAELAKRKLETIRTVEIAQDSLVFSLYDNGTIDGDTVSVLLNNQVIMPRVGLLSTAISKTVYLTPEMGDSISVVMYAENLGSIPPNTGLLVIREGPKIYEIRFSGDLNKNSKIILVRKKKS